MSRLLPIPPKEELEALTVYQVAQKYQVHPGTVSRWRKHHGVTLNRRGRCFNPAGKPSKYDHERIRALILKGKSNGEIAMEIGCCEMTVSNHRERHNRQRRKQKWEVSYPDAVVNIDFGKMELAATRARQEVLGLTDEQMAVWLTRNVWTLDRGFVERRGA